MPSEIGRRRRKRGRKREEGGGRMRLNEGCDGRDGWMDGCDEDSPGSGSGGWPTVTGTGGLLILEATGQS